MALSFKQGNPIAKIKHGVYKGKTLYIDEKGKIEPDFKSRSNDILTESDIRQFANKYNTKLKPRQISELLDMLDNDELQMEDLDSEDQSIITKLYSKLKPKLNNLIGKTLSLRDGFIQPIKENMHQSILLFGRAGVGKSTFIRKFCKASRRRNPELTVVLFSKKDSDPSLDSMNPTRIPLDEKLHLDPIKVEELKDCIVIFDDTEALADPKVDKAVHRLRDDLVNTGRQYGIIVISAVHSLLNHKRTREILQENTHLVYFPMGGCKNQIEGFMKRYVGLKGDTITKLLKIPSRWCMLRIAYPMCVLYETGVMMITE